MLALNWVVDFGNAGNKRHSVIPKSLTITGTKAFIVSPHGKSEKQLNTVGHTEIYAWGVVFKSAYLVGVVGLDMKL